MNANECDLVVNKGQSMPASEAVYYYYKHEREVNSWPLDKKYRYYLNWGEKVRSVLGKQASLPFFAASLEKSSSRQSTDKYYSAWLEFDIDEKDRTYGCAMKLSQDYPLTAKHIKACLKDIEKLLKSTKKSEVAVVTQIFQLVDAESDEKHVYIDAILKDGSMIKNIGVPISNGRYEVLHEVMEQKVASGEICIEVRRDLNNGRWECIKFVN